MVEIQTKQTEFHEGAHELTEDNVQYWCRHTKELAKSQVSKALKFLRNNCIRYVGDFDNEQFNKLRADYDNAKHIFVCLPLNTHEEHQALGVTFQKEAFLKDYNWSEYIIFKKKDGTFECNCQGWQSKKRKGEIVSEGANCSHVLALYFSFKLKRFGNAGD